MSTMVYTKEAHSPCQNKDENGENVSRVNFSFPLRNDTEQSVCHTQTNKANVIPSPQSVHLDAILIRMKTEFGGKQFLVLAVSIVLIMKCQFVHSNNILT